MEKYIYELIDHLKSFGMEGCQLFRNVMESLNTEEEIELAKIILKEG